jgi:hypothetical protein
VLQESVYETFSRRGTIIERDHSLFKIAFAQDQSRRSQWEAFINRTGLEYIPFEIVIDQIRMFLLFLLPVYETILKEGKIENIIIL